uniref:Uncharacterized protein n=1 Tax=Rhizophora mucronata TaxID=61149 RepID=A0A2P2P7U9_RHIMU
MMFLISSPNNIFSTFCLSIDALDTADSKQSNNAA